LPGAQQHDQYPLGVRGGDRDVAGRQGRPKRQAEVNGVVVRLVAPAAKARYQAVSKAVCATPDRWPVVAVINEREAGGRWDRQLGRGDPWRSLDPCPVGEGPSSIIRAMVRGMTPSTAAPSTH
jgi:hypothetical protein